MNNFENLKKQIDNGANAMRKVLNSSYQLNLRRKIFQKDKVTLYRYESSKKRTDALPVLIVFATVNRPEILDLFPEESFIYHLLQKGQDVYLLDWGYPEQSDSHISFEDYICGYLHHCVKAMLKSSKVKKINMIGICQGGVISLCYASMYQYINKLVLVSTPIDFKQKNNLISQLINQIDEKLFDESSGNIPGKVLTQFFVSLRPFDLLGKKYLKFLDRLEDKKRTEKFLLVEKWLHDAPDQPGRAFSDFIEMFYQNNQLIDDTLRLMNKKIKLSQLKVPVLNIIARGDEIIPPSASLALKKKIKPDLYTEKRVKGGHISIYITPETTRKIVSSITRWLVDPGALG